MGRFGKRMGFRENHLRALANHKINQVSPLTLPAACNFRGTPFYRSRTKQSNTEPLCFPPADFEKGTVWAPDEGRQNQAAGLRPEKGIPSTMRLGSSRKVPAGSILDFVGRSITGPIDAENVMDYLVVEATGPARAIRQRIEAQKELAACSYRIDFRSLQPKSRSEAVPADGPLRDWAIDLIAENGVASRVISNN